jgi:hypothetical protein
MPMKVPQAIFTLLLLTRGPLALALDSSNAVTAPAAAAPTSAPPAASATPAAAPAGNGAPAPAAVAEPAAGELRPFETRYAFLWHDMNAGSASFALKRLSAQEWTYSSNTEPRGLFKLFSAATASLESRMSIGPEGVRPLHFTARQGSSGSQTADLSFDWEKLRVSGRIDDANVDVALRAGVQDDLSVQVALIQALAAGKMPQGIALFDKSGIRDYEYTRVGEETLHTPLGDIATVIYRSHRANSSRSTRFWCAPSYGYIPLRAEQQHENDVEWVMELRSLHRD